MTHETKTKRFGRTIRLVPALALVLTLGVGGYEAGAPITAATPALPPVPANGELGFVSTEFHFAFHNGGDAVDCPDGMMGVLRDNYLATLPKAEQDRLNLKENEKEREAAWRAYAYNDKGGNMCSNIYEFMDRPPTAMMKGPVQWGINLDDDETGEGKDAYTCKHQNFTSPTGEKGIDNQLWRAQGCSLLNRGHAGDGKGDRRSGYDDNLKTGQYTQVLRITGINSMVNDPDVTVLYANTNDRPFMGASGNFVAHGSYTVADGPKLRYRNVMRGRIKNGVLTTDPHHIRLSEAGNGQRGEFDLQRGRIKMEFQPDGSIKGIVGGYQPLLQLFGAARGGGGGTINNGGKNCAGEYTAHRLMADGDKDPKTGRCRRISYAYEFVGVPGFVNDVAPAQRIAAK